MKLGIFALAAVAQAKKAKKGKKELTSSEKYNASGEEGLVPDLACADMAEIQLTETNDGSSGQVRIDNYPNSAVCYVDLGKTCNNGVEVEISYMTMETYNFGYDSDTGAYYYAGCWDSIHFTWYESGNDLQYTETQCGCTGGESCQASTDLWSSDMYETDHPIIHNLSGKDAKLVLQTDGSGSGGDIVVDWKCNQGRNPSARLDALTEKALEVVELGGWPKTSKWESSFYNRVQKKLQNVAKSANTKRKQLMDKGCAFPEHWDWQEYLASQTDETRYNQDDPCLATQQVFLGFSRWIEIYTKDCKKPENKQLNFHKQKVKQVNKIRNKMFVDMECAKYIKKYDL